MTPTTHFFWKIFPLEALSYAQVPRLCHFQTGRSGAQPCFSTMTRAKAKKQEGSCQFFKNRSLEKWWTIEYVRGMFFNSQLVQIRDKTRHILFLSKAQIAQSSRRWWHLSSAAGRWWKTRRTTNFKGEQKPSAVYVASKLYSGTRATIFSCCKKS